MLLAYSDEDIQRIRRQMAERQIEAVKIRRETFARLGPPPPWRPPQGPVEPPSTPPGLFSKAMSFIKTVSGPRATRAEYGRRMAACLKCPHLKRDDADGLFCGACGCGRWRLARLDIKLKFARLECPAARW